MCCIGVVVGFSNFWSFPSLMVQHGGFAFITCYLFAIAVFAVPVMVLQVAIGKQSRKSLVGTLQSFEAGTRFSLWKFCGLLLLTAATLTAVLYAVVAGMGLAYVFHSAFGDFNSADVEVVSEVLYNLQQDSEQMLIWLTLFLLAVFVISFRGIHRGLGLAIQYFIPLLTVLLFSLLVYSYRLPAMGVVEDLLLSFDWERMGWPGLLAAFKQAFYSLALGTGVFIVLGAYMPKSGYITRVVSMVACIDMLVGILAGVIIVPWLASANLPPDQGFSLVFHSVPVALGSLPLGQFFGAMFYVLLTLAAWSSAIIMIEPAVAWIEESLRWKRLRAAMLVHGLVWMLGMLLVLSLASGSIFNYSGVPLFSVVQLTVATMLIPTAGCVTILLFTYVLPVEKLALAVGMTTSHRIFRWGYPCLRYLCLPLLIVIQLAVVFDLLVHSCQFDSFRQGALCIAKTERGQTTEQSQIPDDNAPAVVNEQTEPESTGSVPETVTPPETNVESIAKQAEASIELKERDSE